jgi:hypothetical protein
MIVHEDRGGDVHRRHEHHSLGEADRGAAGLDVVGDADLKVR